MNSYPTADFWECYEALPAEIQDLADKAYDLWAENPYHPSLNFKKLKGIDYYSVRINENYRAIGYRITDGIVWIWIGTHADYDRFIQKR